MKKILIIIIVAFVLIQFFPIEKSNPVATPQMDFLKIKNTPERTAALIKNACYDCHSNESKYPWYANIQPVGWFLADHIKEGRKELNFSTFATYDKKRQAKKLKEAAEQLEKNEMPLDSYVILHPEAKLSAADKKELIDYFKFMENDTRILNDLPTAVEKSDFKTQ
ncbi:cytochrome C [Kaistella flava (ex Peng et al. 2021)]|uniref:Cytochrome C n=1 Tax=Kaistella flava (ex Peng et al. 2021) TaxID=2038776 RepID=A0A7M2Y8A2_9FLAO|nr:heme-binding domain-containing protein [Kaistella flava (ex Peng et al. 2021)]QOW10326.1 cytochrome C [Kaistella flava (ex Peng et al. 2021)]